MGSRPEGGLCYMSCMNGESGNLQKAKNTDLFRELQYRGRALLPQKVVTGRGEPEDNGSVEGGAGERK